MRVELFDDEIETVCVVRSADRRSPAQGAAAHVVSHSALRDAARIGWCGAVERHSRGTARSPAAAEGAGQAGGGAAAGAAHALRSRDDAARWATATASKTIRAICRAARRASRRRACTITCRADALLVVDESHQTIPQFGAMYKGDRSRKETLVEYGFRLPSALDNRPLRFEEWEKLCAADDLRLGHAGPRMRCEHSGQVVEQVVRPTGLVDPPGRDPAGRARRSTTCCRRFDCASSMDERVLVTTLTKRMAEDLTEYLAEHGVKVRYLHSDIDTVERVGNHPRPAPRQVRCAGRHQPAARGPGHAGGVAGGDSRRRQGRLPALGELADPDHRPRRAPPQRAGRSCTPTRDTGSIQRAHRRDRSPSRQTDGIQTTTWHHAARHQESVMDVMEGAVAVGESEADPDSCGSRCATTTRV